jgi:hypothetical protein
LLAALSLALAGAPSIAAQGVARTGATNLRLARAVALLAPGAPVRIASAGQRSEGRFRAAVRDSLLLTWQEVTWGVPLDRVDTLWVRQRATGLGAAAGAVVGAVTLTTLGFLLSGTCGAAAGCSGDYPMVIVLGGLVGAGGGALVGASLGSLGRRWSRRYP